MSRTSTKMSARLILLLPLILVAGLLAAVGARLGYMAVTTSETDVIQHYAGKYIEAFPQTGKAEDCHGLPGKASGVWVVVVCDGQDVTPRREYHVNRFGGLERSFDGNSTLAKDET